ncbi:hypothetical protein P3S68_020879 [Capsicum galapagoense]
MVWILIDELNKKGLLSKDASVLVSRRYARGRKVKEAIEAYERMEKYGLIHEDQEYNRLLHTLCKSRNVGKAQEVFDKWKGGNLRWILRHIRYFRRVGWGKEFVEDKLSLSRDEG